jgi:hypothetical protein
MRFTHEKQLARNTKNQHTTIPTNLPTYLPSAHNQCFFFFFFHFFHIQILVKCNKKLENFTTKRILFFLKSQFLCQKIVKFRQEKKKHYTAIFQFFFIKGMLSSKGGGFFFFFFFFFFPILSSRCQVDWRSIEQEE